MKLVLAGGAGLIITALAAGLYRPAEPTPDPVVTASIAAPAAGGHRYTLISTMDENGCAVVAGDVAHDARRDLDISPGCVEANPVLAGAHYWLERPDGTVAFTRPDGSVAAEFSVADGAAFESYSPPQPIMILLADE